MAEVAAAGAALCVDVVYSSEAGQAQEWSLQLPAGACLLDALCTRGKFKTEQVVDRQLEIERDVIITGQHDVAEIKILAEVVTSDSPSSWPL